MTKIKEEEKKKILNLQEILESQISMLALKTILMNHTTHNTPIPKEALEPLNQEIPTFNMTPFEKVADGKPQEVAELPPKPIYMRFSNLIKAQIVEDLFKRVEKAQKVKKIVRGYVR